MSSCCSKHVEAWNKYIEEECVKLVINLKNYAMSCSLPLRKPTELNLLAPTNAHFYILCTLLLICFYMFRCNGHPQGTDTNVVKTYSNTIVLQWLCLSNVQVLVTEQYQTIQLNVILMKPAGFTELDCAGLVSDVMSGFYEHGDKFLVWGKREMPWPCE